MKHILSTHYPCMMLLMVIKCHAYNVQSLTYAYAKFLNT